MIGIFWRSASVVFLAQPGANCHRLPLISLFLERSSHNNRGGFGDFS
jgi:hypothetical protein